MPVKYAKGMSYFSATAIKRHNQKPFKEERVYFGLWFYRDKNPYGKKV